MFFKYKSNRSMLRFSLLREQALSDREELLNSIALHNCEINENDLMSDTNNTEMETLTRCNQAEIPWLWMKPLSNRSNAVLASYP